MVVSSDSQAILDVVYPKHIRYLRPEALAGDETPKLEAIRDAVKAREAEIKHTFKTVIDLDICNPCRMIDDITAALMAFQRKDYYTLISVTEARRNPYFNQVAVKKRVKLAATGNAVFTRQTAPIVYDLNNCIYIYDRDWLMNDTTNRPITDKTAIYLMQDWQAFDIDTKFDLEFVKWIIDNYRQELAF
jgi:CMP-N-acetylneuraminic acid synthetase